MYNIILLSYEDTSNSMFEDTQVNQNQQIPELPIIDPPDTQPSEVEYIAGKSFISFGIMFVSIIILIAIFLIIKKRKNSKISEENLNQLPEEIKKVKEANQQKEEEASIPLPRPVQPGTKNYNINKLNTPSNIKLCIRKFLEKTK